MAPPSSRAKKAEPIPTIPKVRKPAVRLPPMEPRRAPTTPPSGPARVPPPMMPEQPRLEDRIPSALAAAQRLPKAPQQAVPEAPSCPARCAPPMEARETVPLPISQMTPALPRARSPIRDSPPQELTKLEREVFPMPARVPAAMPSPAPAPQPALTPPMVLSRPSLPKDSTPRPERRRRPSPRPARGRSRQPWWVRVAMLEVLRMNRPPRREGRTAGGSVRAPNRKARIRMRSPQQKRPAEFPAERASSPTNQLWLALPLSFFGVMSVLTCWLS
jgi:hypothetical protein